MESWAGACSRRLPVDGLRVWELVGRHKTADFESLRGPTEARCQVQSASAAAIADGGRTGQVVGRSAVAVPDRMWSSGSETPGTDRRFLVPDLAPTLDTSGPSPSSAGNLAGDGSFGGLAVSADADKSKTPLFKHGQKRAIGFEPTTSSLGSWHSTTELRPRGPVVIGSRPA